MTPREADRYEETIVPCDSGRRPHPNRDVGCHEIYAWLRQLRAITSRVTLIFDCCHAGTITRVATDAGERWVEADSRAVEPLPGPWIPDSPDLPAKGTSGWLPLSQAYTLIAACRSNERAHEMAVDDAGGVLPASVHDSL